MSSLELQELSVAYDGLVAVRNVSISISKGSCVSILGANGAGKSSLLKAIVGLSPIAQGDIIFEGRSLKGVKPHQVAARGVMYCPEGRRLFPDLSVLENLQVGGHAARGAGKLSEDLDTIFEMFPILAQRKHQRAGSMSGGEQQMCALGRALMSKPRLLLLDEPSLGLAPMVIVSVGKIIREIKKMGITVLLVEQNAKLALRLSEYAYILDSGELVRRGPSSELLESSNVITTYLGG